LDSKKGLNSIYNNMPKLIVFNQVSLDGFICDAKGDMSWAHRQDAEWKAFTAENAKGGATLLFGRVTYEMMASFWPTPQAMQAVPQVAASMNAMTKVVFSRTLKLASWSNTRLLKGDLAAEVEALKKEPGPDLVLMGSASIVSQLAEHGLVDEFQVVVNPVVLGGGKSMFAGVRSRLQLATVRTRAFSNGNVLICYARA
jgi:dihydrofolate reductase